MSILNVGDQALVDHSVTADEIVAAIPAQYRDMTAKILADAGVSADGTDPLGGAQRPNTSLGQELLEVSFNHPVRLIANALGTAPPAMIEAGKGGAIVNMGSNSWWQGMGGMPVYTTSKSGVHGMTRSFARDLGPHGIRVNTVVPGWIMTERQKELWVNEEDLKKQLERQCIPEPIDPVYVARMVLWLCSDDSAMCSANNFFVEGGAV